MLHDILRWLKPDGIDTDFVGNDVLLGGDADRTRPCKLSPEVVALGVRWIAQEAVTPPGWPEFILLP